MLLTSIADVRDAIRFDDIDEINTAIESALEAATADMINILRTEFDRQERTDFFYIEKTTPYGAVDQDYWRLTAGFVDEDEDFSVELGSSPAEITADPLDIESSCIVNYTRGLITYAGEAQDSKFVKVTYTSGFELGTGDDDRVYQDVPTWLKQAAKLKAIMYLDMVNPTLRHESKDDVDLTNLKLQFDSLVSNHIRYYPAYKYPHM